MAKTHFKKLMNPNYLGAFAFDDPKQTIVAEISEINKEKVIGENGKSEDCIVIRFTENVLPLICNSTNAKRLQKFTKSPYIEDWVGKRIVIGVEKTPAFGAIVDAVRVKSLASGTGAAKSNTVKAESESESTPVSEYVCADCGQPIMDGYGMTAKGMADYTMGKFKRMLCVECAKKVGNK